MATDSKFEKAALAARVQMVAAEHSSQVFTRRWLERP